MLQEQLDKIWEGWKVNKILGEGAFGKVYHIEKEEYQHKYEAALKVISIPQNQSEVNSALNDGMDEKTVSIYFDNIVRDIVKEIILMNELKGDSNIVSYEDHKVVPNSDGVGCTIYIRMELLTPLYEYARKNSFSYIDVIRLGIDMCKALELCHQDKIIHRDIKPENIFVSKKGKYKLGDFGIARQMEKNNIGLSKKGTVTYMAPEVYKGEVYDETVDIYSLGIVLYRFLNNQRAPFLPAYPAMITPVDRERANIMRMSGEKMEKPCNADPKLARVVMKACAYSPKDRYKSATDMKNDLQAILREMMNQKAVEEETVILKETSNNNRGSGKRKILLPLIGVLILGAAGIILLLGNKKIEVPDLTSMTVEEIENKDYGFEVVVSGEEFSEEVEKDGVVFQSIDAGEEVKKGTEIEVIVSRGAAVEVPDLVGETLEDAEKTLLEMKLFIEVEEEIYSDEVEAGEIISQSMEEGTLVEEEETIFVTVSKGEEHEEEEESEPKTYYRPSVKNPAKPNSQSKKEETEETDEEITETTEENDETLEPENPETTEKTEQDTVEPEVPEDTPEIPEQELEVPEEIPEAISDTSITEE